MAPLFLFFLLSLLHLSCGQSSAAKVRVCVAGSGGAAACKRIDQLKKERKDIPLTCFVTQDRYDCLLRLVSKEADVAIASAEDVYLSQQILEGKVQVIGQTRTYKKRNDVMRYDAVAVVRKATITNLDDLSGATSCHTGFRRTAGWHIPISQLLEMKKLKLPCGRGFIPAEQDLIAVSNFFGLACVPGQWAPDKETDSKLKARYPNLCSMCSSPGDCSSEDSHSGYTGALDCLTKSNGDVAWTKFDVLEDYFNDPDRRSIRDQYALLCPDGSLRSLDQSCPWGSRPWDAWLTRTSQENTDNIIKSLKQAMDTGIPGDPNFSDEVDDWATVVLGIKKPSVIKSFGTPITPYKYLSIASYDVSIERLMCPVEPVRLCVTSDTALDKCNALSQILKSRRISPTLSCISKPSLDSDCLVTVAEDRADIMVAEGADVYRGHQDHGLVPLVAEKYGQEDSSYFAVAVVKADSGIKSLKELRGRKSCHTAFNDTAGWKIPVISMLEAGLLRPKSCDYAQEMGTFFSASCAPGAKDRKFDPSGNNPQNLCQLCVGSSVSGVSGPSYSVAGAGDVCSRGVKEAYFGFKGAFRCLVEGGGDVAFVKHTTVGEAINSSPNATLWAEGFSVSDFRLLCLRGGPADVVDFEKCNLARVPSDKVLIKRSIPNKRKEEARILLLDASRAFPQGQNKFSLFGPYHEHSDIIFKDTTSELVNVPKDIFDNNLDESYYRMIQELDNCEPDTEVPDGYNPNPYEGLGPSYPDGSSNPYPDSSNYGNDVSLGNKATLSTLFVVIYSICWLGKLVLVN